MNLSEFEKRHIYEPTLRLWLPFSYTDAPTGTSTLMDRSQYGELLDVTGAVSNGMRGLRLDGVDDFVQTAKAINTANALTVEVIFQRMGDSGGSSLDAYHQVIGGINGAAVSAPRLLVSKDGTIAQLAWRSGESITVANLTPDKPNHFLFTFENADLVCYVNGVARGSLTSSESLPPSGTGSMRIGRLTGTIYISKGLIPLVTIFNRALSPIEVSARHAAMGGLFL